MEGSGTCEVTHLAFLLGVKNQESAPRGCIQTYAVVCLQTAAFFSRKIWGKNSMGEQYQKAKKLGERAMSQKKARGEDPYLPSLADLIDESAGVQTAYLGTFEIPAERIIGTRTRGRQNAFACNYMPILDEFTEFESKWSNLYHAQIHEGIRDAVKIYEYLGNFYVEEGNKRVSVLKYLGVPSILADVTRILPDLSSEEDEIKTYKDFLAFYQATRLYQVHLTKPGSYTKLADLLGKSLDHRWSDDEVKKVKAAYFRFTEALKAKAPEEAVDNAGDSFLIYLTVYPLDSILYDSNELLAERVAKLRTEMVSAARDENIQVVDHPAEVQSETTPISVIKSIVAPGPVYTKEKPLRAAFMYQKNAKESAWIHTHDEGRIAAEKAFDGAVVTKVYENLATDEALARAIDTAVAEGCKVIFTVSADQMEETLRCAIHYKNVRFFNCSLNESHPTVPTYYGRAYEAKFLLGAVAASVARNHKIGYLADYPIYGTIANINAFAIGASFVDPRAKIYLHWSTKKDQDWHQKMAEEEILVASGHDLVKPEWIPNEHGVFWTNWEGDYKKLGRMTADWGMYYELILRSVMEGSDQTLKKGAKEKALNYWYGISSGVIDVSISEKLPYPTRKMIALLREAIINGSLDPFEGELRSKDGLIQEEGSPKLSIEEIIKMNWLNDNVVGEIVSSQEMFDEVKKVVSVSGIVNAEGKKP